MSKRIRKSKPITARVEVLRETEKDAIEATSNTYMVVYVVNDFFGFREMASLIIPVHYGLRPRDQDKGTSVFTYEDDLVPRRAC